MSGFKIQVTVGMQTAEERTEKLLCTTRRAVAAKPSLTFRFAENPLRPEAGAFVDQAYLPLYPPDRLLVLDFFRSG